MILMKANDIFVYGESLRDRALAQVEQNADATWLAQAWSVLRAYCVANRGFVFTVPAFAIYAQHKQGLPKPREPRVYGAIFKQAAKLGLVEKTGAFEPSPDPRQHFRPVACWRAI